MCRIFFLFLFSLLSQAGIGLKAYTFEQTAFEILTKSPEFQAHAYSLDALQKNLAMSANLPDPEISGEYLVLPRDVDNRWTAQLEWGVEWPGVYKARSREAKSRMTAAEIGLLSQRAERLAEIKDLLLDYIRCRRKLLLLEDLANNNDTIYKLAEQAARGGEMTVLDLNKVKLEYANIRVAKATLMDEEAEIIGELSRIYGKDSGKLLEDMEPDFPEITMPSEEEIASIKDKAPAILAAMAEARSAHENKKVAKMEALPSLSLGYKHAFEDGMHFNGAVFGVSVPLFSSRGRQKAAKADIIEAEYRAEAATLEIETEAMEALRRLRQIMTQIDEISPIIENVDYNTALLKAYKGGVITLIEYISDRNYFTNAAVELVSLRHNAAKALALLQRYLAAGI